MGHTHMSTLLFKPRFTSSLAVLSPLLFPFPKDYFLSIHGTAQLSIAHGEDLARLEMPAWTHVPAEVTLVVKGYRLTHLLPEPAQSCLHYDQKPPVSACLVPLPTVAPMLLSTAKTLHSGTGASVLLSAQQGQTTSSPCSVPTDPGCIGLVSPKASNLTGQRRAWVSLHHLHWRPTVLAEPV